MFFKFKNEKKLKQSNIDHSERRSFQHQHDILSILVEDDERVRRFWGEFFSERGMILYLCDSKKSFLEIYQYISCPVQFYFDQDLGKERGMGIRLANLVRNSPYRVSTNLVTAYSPNIFAKEIQECILDFVLEKYPVEVFGTNFFKTRMRQECDERGAETVFAECSRQILQSIEPLLASNGCNESTGRQLAHSS